MLASTHQRIGVQNLGQLDADNLNKFGCIRSTAGHHIAKVLVIEFQRTD